ncbi:MAG: DUF5658 family protein [Planctomycetota bacterium]
MRRSEDPQHVYVDRFGPKWLFFLLFLFVLCLSDGLMTLIHLQNGGVEENPIMDFFLRHGMQTFLVVKLAATILGIVLLCLHKNYRFVRFLMGLLLVLYGALLGYHYYLLQFTLKST